MPTTTKNPFAVAQEKREAEQAEIKRNLGLKTVSPASKKRIRVDLTITADAKQKLVDYANRKGLSASAVVQMLIDEYCV